MFESFGFETLTPRGAAVIFGLGLGLAFGVLGRITGFCLRRAVAGDRAERRPAAGVWLMALATALLGTQAAVLAGLVDFSGHRFFASDLPWLAITIGGLSFGAGMVLTRGCVSRLTVLAGGGNLRALLVLAVFAIAAHATLKGVLAPLRTALGSVTLPLGDAVSLAALPGGAAVWAALLAIAAATVALRSGARPSMLALAALLGLLAPLAWVGTGFVLYDDFDPIALEGLSFTSPYAEGLFWVIASTSIAAGFGVGLLGGVLTGSLLTALARREFAWTSFGTPGQTGRYLTGAVLMGVGGVLAGGCTVGAGLSGVPTLSVAALLALGAIVLGGWTTGRLLEAAPGRPGSTAVAAE
jgi:uncharacterized membrane protein YedE/YeeE